MWRAVSSEGSKFTCQYLHNTCVCEAKRRRVTLVSGRTGRGVQGVLNLFQKLRKNDGGVLGRCFPFTVTVVSGSEACFD